MLLVDDSSSYDKARYNFSVRNENGHGFKVWIYSERWEWRRFRKEVTHVTYIDLTFKCDLQENDRNDNTIYN